MLNNKRNVFVFTILTFCIPNINYSACRVETMEGEVPVQVCTDIDCLNYKTFVEAHLNQRLFFGPSGNGRRLLINHYVTQTNGFLSEYTTSEIVNGYRKEGAPFLINLIRSAIAEAKEKNKIAIMYISDIDEVKAPNNPEQRSNHENAMADQRAALEHLRMESAKYNNDDSKIFIIFSASNINNVYRPFIDHLNGPAIKLDHPNVIIRQRIFNKHFLEHDNIDLLKTKLSTIRAIQPTSYEAEIKEIEKLQVNLKELDIEFTKENERNNKNWALDNSSFIESQKKAYQLSLTLKNSCNNLARKWNDCAIKNDQNKQYYLIQHELYNTIGRSHSNQAFMYYNYDLFTKACNKTRTYYSGRFVQQIAKIIIKTAINENNGIVTREIMENLINQVTQPDPLLQGMQCILALDQAFDAVTRR